MESLTEKIEKFLELPNQTRWGKGSASSDNGVKIFNELTLENRYKGYGYSVGRGNDTTDGEFTDFDSSLIKSLLSFNGHPVYYIDDIPLYFTAIHEPLAKVCIINHDLTTTKAYVIKSQNYFALGNTVQTARQSLAYKITGKTEQERIDDFCFHFSKDKKYRASEFFEWHYLLTGSCFEGRERFVEEKHIKLNKKYTLEEFLNLVENDYDRELIQKVKREKGLL